jgi:hypothetical protein
LYDVQGFLLRYRGEFEGIDRWQDAIVRRSMEEAFEGMLPGMPFGVKTKKRKRWGESVF